MAQDFALDQSKAETSWNASLKRGREGTVSEDWEVILKAVSRLYTRGIEIDWKEYDKN